MGHSLGIGDPKALPVRRAHDHGSPRIEPCNSAGGTNPCACGPLRERTVTGDDELQPSAASTSSSTPSRERAVPHRALRAALPHRRSRRDGDSVRDPRTEVRRAPCPPPPTRSRARSPSAHAVGRPGRAAARGARADIRAPGDTDDERRTGRQRDSEGSQWAWTRSAPRAAPGPLARTTPASPAPQRPAAARVADDSGHARSRNGGSPPARRRRRRPPLAQLLDAVGDERPARLPGDVATSSGRRPSRCGLESPPEDDRRGEDEERQRRSNRTASSGRRRSRPSSRPGRGQPQASGLTCAARTSPASSEHPADLAQCRQAVEEMSRKAHEDHGPRGRSRRSAPRSTGAPPQFARPVTNSK